MGRGARGVRGPMAGQARRAAKENATRVWVGLALGLGALVIGLCALALFLTWPSGGTMLLPVTGAALPSPTGTATPDAALPPTTPGAAHPAIGVRDTAYALLRDEPVLVRTDANGAVLARVRLPFAPTALAVVPAARRVVAVTTGSDEAVSLDAVTLGDPRLLRLPHEPTLLSVVPTTGRVAIASLPEGRVTILDAHSLKVLAEAKGLAGPHDLRFDPDGRRLHVSELDRPRLVTLDARTLAPLSALALPVPNGVDHTSNTLDGRTGLSVSPGSGALMRLDMAAGPSLVGRLALSAPPVRAFTGPRSALAWLPLADGAALARLEIASGSVREIALPAPAGTLAHEPFSETLLVATETALMRLSREGAALATWDGPEIVATAAIESAVTTLLLDARGGLHAQHAHAPLEPERIALPPLHMVATVSALSYCH